jgi:F0F1-type ATP synthase assembly protein I
LWRYRWFFGLLAFVSTTVSFTLLGIYLDFLFPIKPYGFLSGIFLGWGIGIYELYLFSKIQGKGSKKL